MEVVPFSAVAAAEWDATVMASPDGWPFALTAWRRVILGVREWRLEDHSFALVDGSKILAVVPLQLDRRSDRLGSGGWGGCGPIVSAALAGERRRQVLAGAIDRMHGVASALGAKALFLSVQPVTVSAIANLRGVNWFVLLGLDDRSGLAQVIDLSMDEQALWRGLSETARQTVRKATARGVTVERGDWPGLVGAYYDLHTQTYRRTGVTPHPRRYFEGIAHEMAPAGHSVLWVARDRDGRIIAFHNDMHFGIGAWYHTGCSTQDALALGANYLLFWEAIRGAKSAGRLWYDCGEIFPGAADGKSRGLTFFKTRFGGSPHRFLKAQRTYGGPAAGAALAASRGRIAGRVRRLWA